jgi:hypothetical protein
MIDLWSKKLVELMPFLPPGAGLEIANRPPASKSLEVLALPEQIYDGKEAFVYAYQHTMRLGAILPAVGALLAWGLLARRQRVTAQSAGLDDHLAPSVHPGDHPAPSARSDAHPAQSARPDSHTDVATAAESQS